MTNLQTRKAGTGHGGAKLHAVYDGDRFVGTIREVFRDVFYIANSSKRYRSLKDALDALATVN